MAVVRNESTLKSTGFNRGVDGMTRKMKGFGGMMKSVAGGAVAAFSVRAIMRFGNDVIQLGSQLSDLATQTGINVETFQALEYGAIKAGAKVEDVRTVVNKLAVNLGKAKDAQKTYVELFERAGIAQEEIAGLGTEEALVRIGHAFNEAETGTAKFGAALELIGTRGGAKLIEVLQSLSKEGIPQFVQAARDAGIIIDEVMIQKLDKAADKMAIYNRIAKGRFAAFMVEVWEIPSNLGSLAAAAAGTRVPTPEQITATKNEMDRRQEERNKKALQHEKQREELRRMEEQSKKHAENTRRDAERKRDDQARAERLFQADIDFERQKRDKERDDKKDDIVKQANDRLRDVGENIAVGALQTDRLARIGGMIGGQVSPEMRVAERHLIIAQQQKDIQEDMLAALEDLDVGLAGG